METHTLMPNALLDDGVEAGKGTATNKENIRCVNLNELLVRVLTTTLWRHRSNSSFKNFQQRLLHTFALHIASN